MQRIVVRIMVNAVALWVAAALVSGITLEHGFWKVLLVAVVFGIVNAFIKPVVIVLALPAVVLSLGIALLAINALMLLITDSLTAALEVDGFGDAVLGAAVISIVSWAAGRFLSDRKHGAGTSVTGPRTAR